MKTTLTVFFTLHVLSALLALGLPFVIGVYDRRRAGAARGLVTVALVNLSVAVVLGVGALLFISVAWPRPFVSSAVALFGPLMSVVPLLSIAFATLYAYQLLGWRPGPWIAGGAVLAVACVFASIGARSFGPALAARLAHVLPGAFVAAGVAMMVRFAGAEEARHGARLALGAALLQSASGAWALFGTSPRPSGLLLLAPVVSAGGFLVLLGLVLASGRITRRTAVAAAVGLALTVLSMAALREGFRQLQAG